MNVVPEIEELRAGHGSQLGDLARNVIIQFGLSSASTHCRLPGAQSQVSLLGKRGQDHWKRSGLDDLERIRTLLRHGVLCAQRWRWLSIMNAENEARSIVTRLRRLSTTSGSSARIYRCRIQS